MFFQQQESINLDSLILLIYIVSGLFTAMINYFFNLQNKKFVA